ncbi:hypothetical protein EV363DRAFT_1172288 [Boletus edulis]|nr:hypothetical protein EV363DRAFT_1172288 [Boletus edulis]
MSASKALYSEVLYLQQFGFCQVASAAALLYDYLLLFGSEVDFIWARDWNLVTFLYATVRYLGIFLIFSSKWVVATMVTAFIMKNAFSITLSLLALGPGSHLIYHEHDIAGTHVCGILVPKANILVSAQIPVLAFEVLVFGLAFTYFVAHVWGIWYANESKVWKVGDFLRILVRDSTIYFAIIAAATALDYGNLEASGPTVYAAISLALQNFLPFCFAPRLVINVKEHENRAHMGGVSGEELSTLVFNEDRLTQGTDRTEDPA